MTAIAFAIPLAAAVVADHPASPSAGAADTCDFSADGRLCAPAGEYRSAWASTSFYLAIIASVVLLLAVVIVRMYGMIGHPPR